MRYGEQIKIARKLLNIRQNDLIDSGISRVHICDIESGKSKLVSIKAVKLYEKLTYFSLLKDIKITLNFDDLFTSDSHYFKIKKCYEDIFKVKENKRTITTEDLILFLESHRHNNITNIKLFYLVTLAEGYDITENYELSYKYYSDALTMIKYDITSLNVLIYEKTLYAFQQVANKFGRATDLKDFYKDLIDYYNKNDIPFNNFIYYNLAILEKRLGNYKTALELLAKYHNKHVNMSPVKKTSVLLLKACLLTKLDDIPKAIDIYLTILPKMSLENDSSRIISICRNVIDSIFENEIVNKTNIIPLIEKTLKEIIKSDYNLELEIIYSTLGKIYEYKNLYEKSYKSYFKALKATKNKIKYEYLYILYSSYTSFKEMNNLNYFVKQYKKIKIELLDSKESALYYKILSQLLNDSDLLEDSIKSELKSIVLKL